MTSLDGGVELTCIAVRTPIGHPKGLHKWEHGERTGADVVRIERHALKKANLSV